MGFISTVKEFLDSKKWYMAIIGSALVMLGDHYGIGETAIQMIGGIFGTYIVGQGIADGKK